VFHPRRGVHRSALPLAALLALAPIWTPAWAQDVPRLPPTPGSVVDTTAPASVNGAVKLDEAYRETAPGNAADEVNGRFDQDAMELRVGEGAANYGKPVVRRPGQKPRKRVATPPLPTLVPYPTSAEARRARRQERALTPSDPDYIAPSPSTATLPPIPVKTRPKVEGEPFAPVGVNLGLLRVKPYVESDIGYNDNPNSRPANSARGSYFAHEELGLSAASDWSNHSFTGDMRLGYYDYFTAHEADAPDGQGAFLLRFDATRDLKINIDGKFSLTTQSSSSPNIVNGGSLLARPPILVFGGGLGVAKTFNRVELSLRGSAERDDWGDAHFADGSVQRLSLYSYDAFGLTGRASYELTPGVKPFVESTIDRRIHDSSVDPVGYMRDSNGWQARGGSTFELTRIVTGEISAGYGQRNYQDPRLIPLRGPLLDTSLVWTVTPLTKVTLRGASTLDETTVAGSPGVLTHVGTVEIAHALMRNLTVKVTGGITNARYEGVNIQQITYQEGLQLEYSLTRSVVLKGAFTHQRLDSNQPGSDYTANIIMVGLRLQR